MSGRGLNTALWFAAALAADAVLTAWAVWRQAAGGQGAATWTPAAVALVGAAVLFALAWRLARSTEARARQRLAAELRAIAHGGARSEVDAARYRVLAPLPDAVNELAARLVKTRLDLAADVRRATEGAEQTSARLAAILDDLSEGVVVCNLRHQVVLYNRVARALLAESGPLGLSRALSETLAPSPVQHMLTVLSGRDRADDGGAPFLAGSADGRQLFQARMSLIRGADGAVAGYVIALVDAAPQVAALARRDALLREVSEALAAPLARLRAAAGDGETVVREAASIETEVARIAEGYRGALSDWWPMADLFSTDLFALVARRCAAAPCKVTVTGLPVWLHADSHSLALALEALVADVGAGPGPGPGPSGGEIFLSAEATADAAWLAMAWEGPRLAERMLENWLVQPLPALAGMTVRDVLLHHAGDVVETDWREGVAWLRLPMRRGVEVLPREAPRLPARPEFYDLSLLSQGGAGGAQGGRALRHLAFVVFDTETTGLAPQAGDEIVQIGAVRVVNGRILSGETFERIVDPGRPIPPESQRYHRIDDEAVRGKPPLKVVLPQFKAFVADAVLVAHNAAFDLKFLRMREREAGVAFDNPVLDTMLLSAHIDGPDAGHSLDEICARYGIEVAGRHSAIGDAMATAAVLLRQIEALEARGIVTLEQAAKALDIAYVLHHRQRGL